MYRGIDEMIQTPNLRPCFKEFLPKVEFINVSPQRLLTVQLSNSIYK